MNDSQERLSLIGQSILENFSSELIDVIILADFSVPVSKVLKKLAEQYPQKRSSVRVFLISSTRHFISSQDTQKWRRLLAEGDLGRFYFLEDLVSYPNSGSLFNNLFQGNKKAVLLLGAERIYPDGKIVVFPGIRTLAKLALASNLPTIFVAETYKVQPLQGGDILGIGSDIENEEVELGYLELSDNLYLLTDHGLHVKETVNRFQVDQYRRNTFKCCARFWKNRIENKNYPIAIIFDLDGTLLDSEAIHEALYQEVAQKVGYLLSDDEYISKLRGKADEEIIGYIVKQTGEQHDLQQLISYKQKRYKEYLIRGDIPQTKGAIKFIESLAKMGFLLAICTSATSEEVKLGLGKIELFDYFDVIISAENMQQGKPAPEPYLMTAKTLGVLPKECLAYEDSVAGVQSAIAAGMQVVGINTTNIRALIASGAMCVIQDFQNYQLNEMTTR
jgi:beta-phosphoglucomutase